MIYAERECKTTSCHDKGGMHMKLQKITVLALISAAVLSACGRQDVPPGAWSGGRHRLYRQHRGPAHQDNALGQ